MSTRSRYYPRLAPLLQHPSFTASEAKEAGVPSYALCYFVQLGLLERIARGIYRSTSYESEVDLTLEGLALAASTVKDGIICLISALSYYELTDEIPREHWIAVFHTRRATPRPRIRTVRMRNVELGRQTIQIGEYEVAIFDKERCIIDAFRYLSPEIAIKALREYLRDPKSNIRKLTQYAKTLRVKITPYILSLTT